MGGTGAIDERPQPHPSGGKIMNRRSVVSTCVVMALGLALVPNSVIAQTKSLKDQLVGAWTLVSNETIASDGTRQQVLGSNPKGILIFDTNGHYAAVQVDPNRPHFKDDSRLVGTPEENRAVVVGTVASFGTWTVDEVGNVVIMHIEGNILPNDAGRESRRPFTLTGDVLKWTNPRGSTGRTTEVVWKRAQ
jgi:hypothetical protein